MSKQQISNGTVHNIPTDMRNIFISDSKLHAIWQDITPLARNEWICWIESVKKQETRERHIRIMRENLVKGKRRPCCWAGCPHR